MNFKLMFKQSLRTFRSNRKIYVLLFFFLTFVYSFALGFAGFANILTKYTIDETIGVELAGLPRINNFSFYSAKDQENKFVFNKETTQHFSDYWANSVSNSYLAKQAAEKIDPGSSDDMSKYIIKLDLNQQSDDKTTEFSQFVSWLQNNDFNVLEGLTSYKMIDKPEEGEEESNKVDPVIASKIINYAYLLLETKQYLMGDIFGEGLVNMLASQDSSVRSSRITTFSNGIYFKDKHLTNIKLRGYNILSHKNLEVNDGKLTQKLTQKELSEFKDNNGKALLPVYVDDKSLYDGKFTIGEKLDIKFNLQDANNKIKMIHTVIAGSYYNIYSIDSQKTTALSYDNAQMTDYILQHFNLQNRGVVRWNKILNSLDRFHVDFGAFSKQVDYVINVSNNYVHRDSFLQHFDTKNLEQEDGTINNPGIVNYDNDNHIENYIQMQMMVELLLTFVVTLMLIMSVLVLIFMIKEMIDNSKHTLYFLNCMGVRNYRLSILNTLNILPVILLALSISYMGLIWIKNILFNSLAGEFLFVISKWAVTPWTILQYGLVILSTLIIFFSINYVTLKSGALKIRNINKLGLLERFAIFINKPLSRAGKINVVNLSFIAKNLSKNILIYIILSLTFGVILFGTQFHSSTITTAETPLKSLKPYKSDSWTSEDMFTKNNYDDGYDMFTNKYVKGDTIENHKDRAIHISQHYTNAEQTQSDGIQLSGGLMDKIHSGQIEHDFWRGAFFSKQDTAQLNIKTCQSINKIDKNGIWIINKEEQPHHLEPNDPTYESFLTQLQAALHSTCSLVNNAREQYPNYDGTVISVGQLYDNNVGVKTPYWTFGRGTLVGDKNNVFSRISAIDQKKSIFNFGLSDEVKSVNKESLDFRYLDMYSMAYSNIKQDDIDIQKTEQSANDNKGLKNEFNLPYIDAVATPDLKWLLGRYVYMDVPLSDFGIEYKTLQKNQINADVRDLYSNGSHKLYVRVWFKVISINNSFTYDYNIFVDRNALMKQVTQNIDKVQDYFKDFGSFVDKDGNSNLNIYLDKSSIVPTSEQISEGHINIYSKINGMIKDQLNPNNDPEKFFEERSNSFLYSDNEPYWLESVSLPYTHDENGVIVPKTNNLSSIGVMDFELFKAKFLEAVSDYDDLITNITYITIVISVLLSLLMIEIILRENRKNILLFKAVGYRKREIQLFILSGYIISSIVSSGTGMLIAWFGIRLIGNMIALSFGLPLLFAWSPSYILVICILPIIFVITTLLSVILYMRKLKASDAFAQL